QAAGGGLPLERALPVDGLLERLVELLGVPLLAPEVRLAAELLAVVLDDRGSTSLVEGTGARRALPGLHSVRRRSGTRRGHVDQATALGLGVGVRQLTGRTHQQCLDLVRGELRPLLEEQGRSA